MDIDLLGKHFPDKNEHVGKSIRYSKFKVPFGLKSGRLWAVSEVDIGLACDCTCPNCNTPLVAMAKDSYLKRAYFAHYSGNDCEGGYESAIHKMAKQVITDSKYLVLPHWAGNLKMPNPPYAHDKEGNRMFGDDINVPSKRIAFNEVRQEVSYGAYKPDIVALAGIHELLIEIKVTHAVDDQKAEKVTLDGKAMLEIDLAGMDAETANSIDAFKKYVLEDINNKEWIYSPLAAGLWKDSVFRLQESIILQNEKIDLEREKKQKRAELAIQNQKKINEFKNAMNTKARDLIKHELTLLPELTSLDRVEKLLAFYLERDSDKIIEKMKQIPGSGLKDRLQRFNKSNAWIYKSHPQLWQIEVYLTFIHGKQRGEVFSQIDVGRWLKKTFGVEKELYTLFLNIFKNKKKIQSMDYNKFSLKAHYLSEEENRLIPNFYEPIDYLINNLISIGLLTRSLDKRDLLIIN